MLVELERTTTALDVLAEAVRLACEPNAAAPANLPVDLPSVLIDPQLLQGVLESSLESRVGPIRITGSLERRLVFIERADGRWVVADLANQPHSTRDWPVWTRAHLSLDDPTSAVCLAQLSEEASHRLSRPRVLLAALYHPEYFPLPRFPLGISDVARAARSQLLGTVTLADMQLGSDLGTLIEQVTSELPDILGISVTFGQHDLLIELLETVHALPEPPVVIAGGSLTVRNEGLLLQRYPKLLIARGGGEATMEALLQHWHGDIDRREIPGLGFNGAARGGALAIGRRHTPKPVARDASNDILPELDLLPATLQRHGVAQLETSRGCTNYCSFCPRGHKGIWSGSQPTQLPWILGEIGNVFDRHPDIARVIYLVDEEFIGRGDTAVQRALEVAGAVHDAGFKWESSCRIDQVVLPDRDEDWHVERATMWRGLLDRGLRRMLFGVESGVDSILERFNKETTADQNALAIRTLSALGVPTRFTYITFDHLMTIEELKATHEFQGRTDLLIKPQPHLPVEEVVRGVRDEEFVSAHSSGRALHTGISYMLVSMECLIGAAYTRRVEQAGLAGQSRPSMGRVDAEFADWRIGMASYWSQLWVDRNFALDYTLKSQEKILDGTPRLVVRETRSVLKDASYRVLGAMIDAINEQPDQRLPAAEAVLNGRIERILNREIDVLRDRMSEVLTQTVSVLPAEHRRTLHAQHDRWTSAGTWELINASDSCGT
ncbi:radical SAM protein [Streptomyces sp. NPDC050508]|uniref:B12-binding domain-containing radical SAM protein n=1 Tax=Streptomyces sp. NPDC050508 TaxID=3155405 RepID=UPI003440DAF7